MAIDGLQSRVAIVTGAGGGIERAIALRLAQEGCGIDIFDQGAAGAEQTAALVRAAGMPAAVAVGGVERPQDVAQGVVALTAELGEVDTLPNNAGILRTAPFLETSAAARRDGEHVPLDG